MKISPYPPSLLSIGLVFGLFAGQQGFVLSTPDDPTAGHGTLETGKNGDFQVSTKLLGKAFSGTGHVSSASQASNRSLRSDRALLERLGKPRVQHGSAKLTAEDGSLLACEFQLGPSVDLSSGYCRNSADQQFLTVHFDHRSPS